MKPNWLKILAGLTAIAGTVASMPDVFTQKAAGIASAVGAVLYVLLGRKPATK